MAMRHVIHADGCEMVGPTGTSIVLAPSATKMLWRSARWQEARRVDAIAWSLAEAMKDADRRFLKEATSIAMRDERDSRLMVRFSAARRTSRPVRDAG
jgi:hypothetical protein